MPAANGTTMLATVCSAISCDFMLINVLVTRVTPVGNGGKFTPEARAIYELVLEMQRVRVLVTFCNSRSPTVLRVVALHGSSEAWFALGRDPAPLSPHARSGVPTSRNFQVP